MDHMLLAHMCLFDAHHLWQVPLSAMLPGGDLLYNPQVSETCV